MKRYHELLWNATNVHHISRHQVTSDEIERVVFSSGSIGGKGRGDGIYYIFGCSREGRYLFTVLAALGGEAARVIISRDMTRSEKRWFAKHK